MSFTNRVKNVFGSIKNSFKRFPVTIGISTVLVIMLIFLSERSYYLSNDTMDILQRASMIIALGIPLSLCIKLIYEKRNILNRNHQVIGYMLGLGILILYYLFLLKDFSMISMVRYAGTSMFLYLGFTYIPWISRKDNYEFYIIKIFSSFFLTIIYSAVLYIGIAAILLTIDQLFDANIPGKYFYYIFLVVAGIFAPSLFLSRLPNIDEDFINYEYPKSLKVLLLYIVMPLITIYSTVLYAYFFKILLTRNWPSGLVSHLVLWYSVLSVAVIFFITPILDENRWARKFKLWFTKFIIPILIMMFISIGIRIKAYGITENRYFVLALALWVFGIMNYLSFRKKQNNIIIPISLSIIVLNSVFGPLSSFSISKLSQNHRLKSILIRNQMLEDDRIIKASENISSDDKSEVSMIIKYFESNHTLEKVRYLPKDFHRKDMELVFGFPYTEKSLYKENYFYIFSDQRDRIFDVKGYDYLLEGYSLANKVELKDNITVQYDLNKFNFTIEENGERIYKTDLRKYGLEILKKNNAVNVEEENMLDIEDMTFIDENDKVKIKFIIKNVNGEKGYDLDEALFISMEYYVLIQIK